MTDESHRTRPEAELRTLLSSSLARAFPGIPQRQFHHETRFTVRLGHEEHEVNGERFWEAEGRADILLFHNGRALAVVELKRGDKKLTDADVKQGQSYANQLTPRPPLVIVTNGTTTLTYDSSTGELWQPGDDAGETLKRLFENAATIAAAGLSWAVETLMGPEAGVWASAVRRRTRQLIDSASGAPGDPRKVFMRDLLFPRRATAAAHRAFDRGARVILISGPPTIGKSHVLREFAERTADSGAYAVFVIRAGGGGAGLFQRIANLLSAALEWSVEPGDVRQWLRRLSSFAHGPALVLALDGLTAGSAIAADLEELADAGFGLGLRVLASVNETRSLLVGANGRDETALAALAEEIEVGPLDEEEFEMARQALQKHRITFMDGARFAIEYRVPWVLRSLTSKGISSPRYTADEEVAVAVPPSLGLDLVLHGRKRLARYIDAQRGYRLLARDAIADEERGSPELELGRTHSFLLRRDALSVESRECVEQLIDDGWLAAYRHAGGEEVVAPRAPEMFLSELSEAVSAALKPRVESDPREAGHWLADRLEAFFLGDLIGAQGIVDFGRRNGGFSSGIVSGLLEREPVEKTFGPGLFGLPRRDGSIQNFRVTNDGKAFLADDHGNAFGEPIDLPEEDRRTRTRLAGWMILAQLARLPAAEGVDDRARVDRWLLLGIGTCPFPLMRAADSPVGHLVHEIEGQGEILCDENGVAESITASMLRLVLEEWHDVDNWIDDALARRSLPLLSRIRIALLQVQRMADDRVSAWASLTLNAKIEPAVQELLTNLEAA
jgi:hypothetical protein